MNEGGDDDGNTWQNENIHMLSGHRTDYFDGFVCWNECALNWFSVEALRQLSSFSDSNNSMLFNLRMFSINQKISLEIHSWNRTCLLRLAKKNKIFPLKLIETKKAAQELCTKNKAVSIANIFKSGFWVIPLFFLVFNSVKASSKCILTITLYCLMDYWERVYLTIWSVTMGCALHGVWSV